MDDTENTGLTKRDKRAYLVVDILFIFYLPLLAFIAWNLITSFSQLSFLSKWDGILSLLFFPPFFFTMFWLQRKGKRLFK